MAGNFKNRKISRLNVHQPGESAINFWELVNKAVVLSIGAAVVILTFIIFIPVIKNVRDFERTLVEKQTLLDQEQKRMNILNREVELLRTDRDYNERVAREKFGLAKPNETIFRFTPIEQK